MRPLLLLLLALAAGCQTYTDDLLKVANVERRTDGIVPQAGEYRSGLADTTCINFDRLVVPPGWCVSVSGNVGDVIRSEGELASCSTAISFACQMYAAPYDSDVTEIYLQHGGDIEFNQLSTGCVCH